MPKEKVTFGIIGVGGIANSQHLPNLTRAAFVELKAVCDLDEERLRTAQGKYEIPMATTKHREVLEDPEIDAVLIATREDMQARLAVEAMWADKHVYVEKPLAATVEQCETVVRAQKETGMKVAVGFNRRLAPAYRKAKEILDRKGGAHNVFYRIADNYVHGWGKNRDHEEGLRVIHEVCHIFDILRFFTGSEPVSIYCAKARPEDELFTIRFENGAIACLMNSGYGTEDYPKERCEIIAEHGALTIEEFVELRTFGFIDVDPVYRFAGHTHRDREYTQKHVFRMLGAPALLATRRAIWEHQEDAKRLEELDDPARKAELDDWVAHHQARHPPINYMVDKGWLAAVDHFAECIRKDEQPRTATAIDGLQASRMSHAAIESRETGQIVSME